MIEQTLVLIKPDGVQRGLVGEVIKRFEQRGLKIVALKMVNSSRAHIYAHYPEDNEWLGDYLTMCPVIAMVVQGASAIKTVRKLVGHTYPVESLPGTIRGDFSIDTPSAANVEKRAVKNIVHASGNDAEASHEIEHWFSPEEIHDYKRADENIMF